MDSAKRFVLDASVGKRSAPHPPPPPPPPTPALL